MSPNQPSGIKAKAIAGGIACLVIAGILASVWGPARKRFAGSAGPGTQRGERRILYYVDPMHPSYKSDKPGIAPDCGMPLTPVYDTGAESAAESASQPSVSDRGQVEISTEQQQLTGMTTVSAEYRPMEKTIRAVGRVEIDETRIARIHTRFSGYIQRVFVDSLWQKVEAGTPLFTVYSPEVVATEMDYLLALKGNRSASSSTSEGKLSGVDSLLRAARMRLLVWGVTQREIDSHLLVLDTTAGGGGHAVDPLEGLEVTFTSPIAGFVTARQAYPTIYVTPEVDIYTVADLSHVWVYTDVYESDMRFVSLGQDASLTIDSYPGKVFHGKISYIWPQVQQETRTVRVRMEFLNPDMKFRPGMYGSVEIKSLLGRHLVVPDSAVLDSGTRQLLFVEKKPGTYLPRNVTVGVRTDGYVEISSGLKAGEIVANSAGFFLDSESQLRAALSGMALGSGVTGIGGQLAPATPNKPEVPQTQVTFHTQPEPPRAGKDKVSVSVRGADGKPVDGARVVVVFYMPPMPSMNMPAMRAQAILSPSGPGTYTGEIQVQMPGTWQVSVEVQKGNAILGMGKYTVNAE